MSYILDALKKSEQARLNVDTPLRQLLLRGEEMSHESRRVWPYIAGAALLLNAAALYVWWRTPPSPAVERQTQPTQTREPTQLVSPNVPAAIPPPNSADRLAVSRAVPTNPPPVRENPPPLPVASMPPAAPPVVVAVAPPVATVPAQPTVTTSNATRAVSAAATATVVPPAAGETGKEIAGEPHALDLPEALRRELPPLVMSGMVRQEGTTGWVVVNERPFREGEEVAPGLRVEKILERGAQFSYKGYRFQR
jgi:general secretion pathway protein B